jgi:CRISPR system Cascade subunit CasB
MSEKDAWKGRFIERLLALAPPGRPQAWDRGTLAELRRGLGKDASRALIRAGWLFRDVPGWGLDGAAVVAALFASHPEHAAGIRFGRAFRRYCDDAGSESAGKRFVALLDSDNDDLPDRLRHAVTLLKAKGIAPDWGLLLNDVLRWDSPHRTAQRQWSRDFWAERAAEGPEPAPAPTSTDA